MGAWRSGREPREGVIDPPGADDLRQQGLVLSQVLLMHPVNLRLPELVRELTHDSALRADRERIERAVRELAGAGLLFRCDGVVLPTRAALCFERIVESGESIW